MLTHRQAMIMSFITTGWLKGMPPTFREIGQRFKIKSPNGVGCHLKALRAKGFLQWEANLARNLIPLRFVSMVPLADGRALVFEGTPAGPKLLAEVFVRQYREIRRAIPR